MPPRVLRGSQISVRSARQCEGRNASLQEDTIVNTKRRILTALWSGAHQMQALTLFGREVNRLPVAADPSIGQDEGSMIMPSLLHSGLVPGRSMHNYTLPRRQTGWMKTGGNRTFRENK